MREAKVVKHFRCKLINSKFLRSQSFITNTASAFLMKVLSAFFGLLLNVVLARTLGTEGTGLFYLALSCASIAMVLSQFGLGQSLLRFIATAYNEKDWNSIKGVLHLSQRYCLIVSVAATALLYILAPFIAMEVFDNADLISHIRLIALAVLPSALFVLKGYSFQAIGRFKTSIFTNGVSTPMFASPLMLVLTPWLGLRGSIFSYVLAAWITLLCASILWKRYAPELREAIPRFSSSTLLRSNIPLFWVSLSQLVMGWSSSILLGVWASETEVGLFSIAYKTALLLSFILSCVNTVIAPRFAKLYKEGNLLNLQKLTALATALMFMMSTPLIIMMLAIPDRIMKLFGPGFIAASDILVILALGQFLFVVTGTVGFLLSMSGRERVMRNIMVSCSFLLMVLNLLFIPSHGAIGAAFATSITLVTQNLLIIFAVWKYIGILPFAYPTKNNLTL